LKLENMMAVESTLINALKVHKEKNARKVLLKALENVRSGKKSE
jgi:hypothetical protein